MNSYRPIAQVSHVVESAQVHQDESLAAAGCIVLCYCLYNCRVLPINSEPYLKSPPMLL